MIKSVSWIRSSAAIVLGLAALTASASLQTINNDSWWKDQSGNPLYAQGGGINKFGSTYYMYGVEYNGAHTYYNNGTVNSDTSFKNITCYSSTDLVHWTWRSEAATPTELPGASWVGRLGACVFNSSTGKYVIWCQYYGSAGSGQACLTSSSPTGRFTRVKVQAISGLYNNTNTGDSTIFCDVAHSNKPYLICSDSHGRQHAYICTLSSDYQTINPAIYITTWPNGQEANCMFEFGGTYHYVTSETNGWSYSQAYEVRSTSPTGGYSSDATFNGTTSTHTYYSQISYFVHNLGSAQHTIVAFGDRWADFSSNYKNAGHGNNYLIACPVTIGSGNVPTFVARSTWQFDDATGNWQ